MSNPYANAFRHLVASHRERYQSARRFGMLTAEEFRCHRMTARDSGPNNNESGERHREPINTTAAAERKVEDSFSCPDPKRELDSAQKVESGLIPSVRPAAHLECVGSAAHCEANQRDQSDSTPEAPRGTSNFEN